MLLSHQHSMLTELIQDTIVKLCRENVPFENRLELDGLICINSDITGSKQLVVKIHRVVEPNVVNKDIPIVDPTPRIPTKPIAIPFTSEPFCLPSGLMEVAQMNGLHRPINAHSVNDTIIVPVSATRPDIPPIISHLAEVQTQAWQQRAPQILKLLTKPEQLSVSRGGQVLMPTDLSRTSTIAAKPVTTAPSIAKKELNENKVEDLTVHSNIHSTNKWRCKICHIHCSNFNELELHMRSEHVRFICRLCLNSFTLSCNLRRHMKLHAGVRPHICSHCSATFSRSTDLKIHMKKHTDLSAIHSASDKVKTDQVEKSFHSSTPISILHECDVCNKGFATASHLADHRLTHQITPIVIKPSDNNSAGNLLTDVAMSEIDKTMDSDGQMMDLSNNSFEQNDDDDDDDNSMDCSVDLSVKIPKCVSDVDSSLNCANNSNSVVEVDAAAVVSKVSSRSKRKGMPVKRVDAVSDDNDDELLASDEHDSSVQNASSNDHSPNPHLPPAPAQEAAQVQGSPSPSPAVVSNTAATTDEEEDDSNGRALPNDTTADTEIYNCQWAGGCNTTHVGFAAYEQHYVAAHGGRYPCAVCPQSFTSRNNRRRHADGHAGSPGNSRHQCTACGKHFARADISKEHRLTHTKSYRLGTCVKCGETGSKRSSLLLHLKRCLTPADIDNDIDESENTASSSTTTSGTSVTESPADV